MILAGVFAVILGFCSSLYAQDPQEDPAPPPLKMMSKTERSQLTDKLDIKERTNLALQFMDLRVKSAEKFRTDENYSLMYAELGGFHALMENTLDYLLHTPVNEGKRLNSLKKFEISLREFTPRIEALKRDSPANFEPYIKSLLKYIDDARDKAVEPFFRNAVN
jgi:hypothetical protein